MRVSNSEIGRCWAYGDAASSHTGNFWTDGEKLYSYRLCIGDTCPDSGKKVLRDHTSSGKHPYHSQTTSCHVGRARQWADIVD